MRIATIGRDLAKRRLQIHGVDAAGKVVVKRTLGRTEAGAIFWRQERCLAGMEAGATAAKISCHCDRPRLIDIGAA